MNVRGLQRNGGSHGLGRARHVRRKRCETMQGHSGTRYIFWSPQASSSNRDNQVSDTYERAFFFYEFATEITIRTWSLPVTRIFESRPLGGFVLAVEQPKTQMAELRAVETILSGPAHVDATPLLLSYEGTRQQ